MVGTVKGSPPRVSVLMPVWRAEATLDEALHDVRAQTREDWECVLVLDGVADASAEIARRHAAADPRVRVLELPHAGIVPALVAGLAACRAPLVARFDADDRMAPERLALQVAHLEAHPEVALVTCRVRFEVLAAPEAASPVDLARSGMARHAAWLDTLDTSARIRAARFIDAPVAHPAVTYRKAAVDAVGGYRAGPFAEDHDLWLRMFAAGLVFARVDDVLVTWRDGAHRLTRTDTRYADAERRALVHHHLLVPGGPAAGKRIRIWGAGEYGRRHAKELAARGAQVDDLLDIDPKKVGRRVAGGIPVVSADGLGPPDGRPILVAVATPGARAIIADRLDQRGYREDLDWWALQ